MAEQTSYCVSQAHPASVPTGGKRLPFALPAELFDLDANTSDSLRQVPPNELRLKPQHPIAGTRERPIPPPIRRAPLCVTTAVDFDDEPNSGASKSTMNLPS